MGGMLTGPYLVAWSFAGGGWVEGGAGWRCSKRIPVSVERCSAEVKGSDTAVKNDGHDGAQRVRNKCDLKTGRLLPTHRKIWGLLPLLLAEVHTERTKPNHSKMIRSYT